MECSGGLFGGCLKGFVHPISAKIGDSLCRDQQNFIFPLTSMVAGQFVVHFDDVSMAVADAR